MIWRKHACNWWVEEVVRYTGDVGVYSLSYSIPVIPNPRSVERSLCEVSARDLEARCVWARYAFGRQSWIPDQVPSLRSSRRLTGMTKWEGISMGLLSNRQQQKYLSVQFAAKSQQRVLQSFL